MWFLGCGVEVGGSHMVVVKKDDMTDMSAHMHVCSFYVLVLSRRHPKKVTGYTDGLKQCFGAPRSRAQPAAIKKLWKSL